MPSTRFIASLFLALPFLGEHFASAADECQPSTWANRMLQAAAAATPRPTVTRRSQTKKADDEEPAAGDIVCRYWSETDEDVSYYTCTEFSNRYGIPLEKFFLLNPEVDEDCSNLEPYTEYCVAGFIQPIVNTDGTCGPKHGNATCVTTDFPCCNSQTWKCGDTEEDCSNGICYEGYCLGHDTYTTDGTCGYQNLNRLCAGPWGDCCNFDGECGTGDDFCGDDHCQSGNCTTPIGPTAVIPDI